MENNFIEKLNNLSLTTLKEKLELIEEMKLPFEVIEDMNDALNHILLVYMKSIDYKRIFETKK